MLRDFLDNLFDDIGGKIKGLVKWSFAVEAILVVVAGIIAMLNYLFSGRFLLFLLIPFAVVAVLAVLWVGSWVMYAFGEMVQRVCNIDDRLTIARPAVSSGNKPADKDNAERNRQKVADVVRKEAAQRAIREAEGRSSADNAAMIQRSRDERIRTAVAEYAGEDGVPRQEETEAEGKAKLDQQLADNLAYALAFKTDDGMIRYLRSMDHELVNQILKEPRHMIRKLIGNILEEL